VAILIVVCTVMWRRVNRREKETFLAAVQWNERRRRCQICYQMYDCARSDAPELWREEFCGEPCYKVWVTMQQFEVEGRLPK